MSKSSDETAKNVDDNDSLEQTLINQFREFHQVFQKLSAENEQLRKDAQNNDFQISQSRENEKSLMQELSLYKHSMSSIQSSLKSLSHIEDENRRLCGQITELEQKQTATQTQNDGCVLSLRAEICNVTSQFQSELARIKSEYETKAQKEIEIYVKMVNDKEKEIQQLAEDKDTLQKQHEENVLRIGIDHEHKLIQMQERCTKLMLAASKSKTTGMMTSSVGVDILRQKIKNIQQKYDGEVFDLKKTISSLQAELELSNDDLVKVQETKRSATKRKKFLYSETTEYHM